MASPAPKMTFAEVERRRREFSRALRDYAATGQRYHNPASAMPDNRYEGAQVVPNRLALFDRLPSGGIIAETGVSGDNIAGEILRRAAPASLHLFGANDDILEDKILCDALRGNRLVPHAGADALALKDAPENFFDAIYLSGEATFDGVAAQLDCAARKVKTCGSILVNSYTVWSVISMFHCGTARAVNEFCRDQNWKLACLALDPMGYYNVALERI